MPPRWLLPLAVAGLCLSVAARAAVLTGTSLSIDDLCAKRVVITPDPSLKGRVSLDLAAANPQELTSVTLGSGNGEARITGHFCAHGLSDDRKPTLLATILVPPGMALHVTESTVGDYRIGAVGGPMVLRLSGANAVSVAAAGPVDLSSSGSGAISIDHIEGDLDADLSGSSALSVGAGEIGHAHLDLSGVGQASIGAIVREGWFDVSGVGSISLAHPVGVVHRREISGVGRITIAP
ncbi:hypothetical protein FHR90_002508 [Endobacter medicaginis]|uniref:Auto-transporter adhesin head GIN domain-containing protein n=1 Tax=Endobacter medicaginis TaxID=1181271 RepID=A0A839V544_9PROT|nr:hypothetical protein [Endobacter medicaginis]MBB3174662.1 hypothetical protein [Endobacter medicaginis]MCX5474943.1 hypothetical protein [Endobacter medicaginis]NVN29321.1 hypothetical protein [Endobacter medicaginis]